MKTSSFNSTTARGFLLGAAVMLCSTFGALAAAETYEIDAVHSTISFKIKRFGVSTVTGSFHDFKGGGTFDASQPGQAQLEVTVQAASIDTGSEKRDTHLKSPDFFDVAKYPTLSFKSTKLEKVSDTDYKATGDFTMMGVTKPVTFDVTITADTPVPNPKGGQQQTLRVGDASFTIKRSDYGMSKMIGPISDEVRVELDLTGVKK